MRLYRIVEDVFVTQCLCYKTKELFNGIDISTDISIILFVCVRYSHE